MYCTMPLDRGSQNVPDFTDQTLYESVSKKKEKKRSSVIQNTVQLEEKERTYSPWVLQTPADYSYQAKTHQSWMPPY